MRPFVRLFSVLLCVAIVGCEASAKAPGWTLKTPEGKQKSLVDYEGKVVILAFWATWCPPCVEEIPVFNALQKSYGDQGLAIVGISGDQVGGFTMRRFAKRHNITYPIVMADEQVLIDYGGIRVLPTTFIIDRKGRIVSRHVGPTAQATFEQEIKPLL